MLNLFINQITDIGAEAIAHSKTLYNLTSLFLCHNQIGAVETKNIANSQNLSKLTYLDLAYNQIEEAWIDAIAKILKKNEIRTKSLLEMHYLTKELKI